MMPRWEDVTEPHDQHRALADRQARRGRSARRNLHDSRRRRATCATSRNSSGSAERDPAWSPDGKFISYFSDKSGEYKLVHRSAGRPDAAARDRAAEADALLHAVMVAGLEEDLYSGHESNVWVLDVASGQAKIVGNDPWMVPQRTLNPVWSPDSKWVAYASRLNSLYHAIFVSNVETGETKQVTDGLADAMWPAWDASGKYLWFLASTDFGLRSQWLDMTSYDHDETSACTSRC